MNETDFCPYCDELVTLNIIDDYYLTNQCDEVERIDCPSCGKPIIISWELQHKINFREV